MTRWMEPTKLLDLVMRDSDIRGAEAPEQVILREPSVLLPIAGPGLPPLDVATYEIRRARWREGEGPSLTGIEEFVAVLESLAEAACAVTVHGGRTSYTYLLDAELSRVLAGVAIDPPAGETQTSRSAGRGGGL